MPKITDYPIMATPDGTETLLGVQAGQVKSATVQQISEVVTAGAPAQAAIATAQAVIATTQAGNAAASAGASATSATAAQTAQTAAETARDAAQASGNIYATTAAGLAATTNGKYFSIPSASGNGYLDLYLNNAGSAVLQKTYPSSAKVASIDTRLTVVEPVAAAVLPDKYLSDDLVQFADGDGKIVGRVRSDAGWDILLNALKSTTGLTVYEYDTLSGSDSSAALVDAAGKVLAIFSDSSASGAEVVSARGTRVDLNTRISQSVNPYGSPIHHFWGEWYLRETRQRIRKRLLGESAQLVVASIGDSWTHNATRWTGPTAVTLKTAYGDAGAGYVSFAMNGSTLPNGNILNNAAVTYTGTWDVSNYYTAYSPDLGQATSSTATDRLSYTIAASPSAVKLYAQGGAGVVRYRFNAGAWTSIDLSILAAGLQVINLASPVAGIFDVEVVSGAPVLFGLDVQTTADGVRWHKLGSTGSRAQQWAAVDATQWQSGMAALAPNLVIIMHATNDQAAYDATAFSGYLQTVITRVKTALPLADIMLICPCENGRGLPNLMTTYAAATYQLAAVNKCAFLDLQYLFGDSFSEYASTSPRAWFNADTVHPEPSTGGRVIVDAVTRLLTQN